jgi:hypothetical protein
MTALIRRLVPTTAPDAARRLLLGRTAIAGAFLVAPVGTVRSLGCDTATARRVGWLTRMMAVRDGVLGVGGLLAVRRGGDAGSWLVGGAAADALDTVVIAQAIRQGRLAGLRPAAVVPAAGLSAAFGMVTAVRLRRG